jgi:UPF0042 nucleotide-binding protein
LNGTAKADPGAKLVVITGLSGSGKSTVAKCFEDLGYYCVENLPLPLLSRFLVDPAAFVEGQDRIAIVADVRAPGFATEAPKLLAGVDRDRVVPTLVFLDSSDDALVRRFSETRRPHPLAGDGPPIEGIRRERELLSDLRGAADLVLDTSDSSLHDIRALIFREFGGDAGTQPTMVVSLLSFGFKFGTPPGADLMFDVRFLPNPHFVPGLREHTGCESPVLDYLDGQRDFGEAIQRFAELLRYLLPRYRRENRSYLTIAIGCTGGRHRSVAAVERLARLLENDGWPARVVHRDLDRERG